MIRDYRAVEKEYNAIIGKEANEEYVMERKKLVKEIESVRHLRSGKKNLRLLCI
jgi:hypothetical protein